jgi:hypothetical protein
MSQIGADIEEDLQLLEVKIKQLRFEYEQYFLGNRNRAPQILRGEAQKMIALWGNLPIQNTRHRFRFNNLRARFFSFKRHWDETMRKIEEGRYERDVFKANLRDRNRATPPAKGAERSATRPAGDDDLFEAYVAAREACGQDVKSLSRAKLDTMLRKQESAICEKLGCSGVRFRVTVEKGKVKLKASPVR